MKGRGQKDDLFRGTSSWPPSVLGEHGDFMRLDYSLSFSTAARDAHAAFCVRSRVSASMMTSALPWLPLLTTLCFFFRHRQAVMASSRSSHTPPHHRLSDSPLAPSSPYGPRYHHPRPSPSTSRGSSPSLIGRGRMIPTNPIPFSTLLAARTTHPPAASSPIKNRRHRPPGKEEDEEEEESVSSSSSSSSGSGSGDCCHLIDGGGDV